MKETSKKQSKILKSRRWIAGFLALVFVCTGCYMAVCYKANPEGYFSNIQGVPYYFKDDCARAIKSRYILDHKDEIDAVVMGGSKCGVVDTDKMTEYTGLRYYNLYLNLGNFHDYLDFTKFLAEEVGIREITLILSNYEVLAYDRTYRGNNYQTPALFSGSLFKQIQEFLSWMIVDPETLKVNLDRLKINPAYADAIVDGRRSRMATTLSYNNDPDAFAARVLRDYDTRLGILFSQDIEDQSEVIEQNLSALSQMKKICEENDVNFQVVIGPSTMTERYRYETPDYYRYNLQIINMMGKVWDFSNYNDINMNYYNYYDHLHYDAEVSDLMVDTMYGKASYDGFGQLLTTATAGAYYQEMQEEFDKLKEEYQETGTVKLQDKNDPSYLPWRTDWVSSKAAESDMRVYWDSVKGGHGEDGMAIDDSSSD